MSKIPEYFDTGISVENNPKTGYVDFTFAHPEQGTATMGLHPMSAIFLVNVAVGRLIAYAGNH